MAPLAFFILSTAALTHCVKAIDTTWADSMVYPTYTVNVRDFGAVGNGIINDAESIQSAIKHVSSYTDPNTGIKGGIVSFPSGQYLSGQIELLSNSFLYLDQKATIYAGTNYSYYPTDPAKWVLITSNNANNIGIFGEGNINGQNHKYIQEYDEYKNQYIPIKWEGIENCSGECRPRLVQLINSTNITLSGSFKLLNSPDWT